MSRPDDRPGAKGFDIPDLDLPPPNPRSSQSSLRAVVPPDTGAPLDLELEGPISRASVLRGRAQEAQFEGDGFELDPVLAPPLPELSVAPEGRANWPTGKSPAREQLVLDPVEIRALAGYGAPPSFALLNAVYALRVTLRKRALKAKLRAVEHELLLAEAARDAALAELAESLLPVLSQSEAFGRVLAPLAEVDNLTHDRGRALSETGAEHSAEVGRIDTELAAMDGEISAERAARAELSRVLEEREQRFRRAEARHKRCFIEMRGIEQQAAQRVGPAGGEMPPDLRAQLAPLQAQAEALKPELEQARAAYQASRAESEARERAIQALELRKRQIERKKTQVAERFQKQLSARQQGLGEATAHRRTLLAEVGRAVLAARGGVTLGEPELQSLREADEKVRILTQRSELYLHALDACDNEKVKSGFAGILMLVTLLAGYLAYRAFLA